MSPGAAPVSLCWRDAIAAVGLMVVDPAGIGGLRLRHAAAPARKKLLEVLRAHLPAEAPVRRLPPNIPDDRLLGGLDLAATLSAGRPVHQRGVLAEADGGVLVIPGAERASPGLAARIAAVLDRGMVAAERDGFGTLQPARFSVLACDDGAADDAPPPAALTERLGFVVDLSGMRPADLAAAMDAADVEAAQRRLPAIEVCEDQTLALAEAAAALGICGLRPLMFARAAARASAALAGRSRPDDADLELAARLVLGPRATCAPAAHDDEERASEPKSDHQNGGSDHDDGTGGDPRELAERVLSAAAAALPAGLLQAGAAAARSASAAGRSGAVQASPRRGRPIGSRPGRPEGGARLDLVATLRAAAPWQAIRRREAGDAPAPPRILVRREDFRIQRLKERRRTLTIFVVDASGSAALHRLGETKGAVELLLGEAYVRRDEVALIAFRGIGAELLLPPTRSLARAKRSLGDLPGGGGTPLASAIDAAALLAVAARRRGDAPALVFLTDGQANVSRNGEGGRARAQDEAAQAARALKALGLKSLVIDVSPRPNTRAEDLSAAMGARYLPLPCADAPALARAAAS